MKRTIYGFLKELISTRINDLEQEVADMVISRDADSKSTAGDKHEVGRAMAQIELDNLQAQLQRNLTLEKELGLIHLERSTEEVGKGNLVKTNIGTYFLSIGLGATNINGEEVFVISSESPIGQLLMGKKKGDQIEFNKKVIHVEEIS